MIYLLLCLLIAFLIVGIIFLVKAIKQKNNIEWLRSFSINISLIVCTSLICLYTICNTLLKDTRLDYLVFCVLAIFVYILLLGANIVFKIIEYLKNKKKRKRFKPLEKSDKVRTILISFVFIFLVSLVFCLTDYSICVINRRTQINTYNSIKSLQLNKMSKYLNEKYDLNVKESDCIYYRSEDYDYYAGFLSDGHTNNIPYIAVFKVDNEEITVADRKGFISDNRQLNEINQLLIDYFYKKTQIKFDYIDFREYRSSVTTGNQNYINRILQTKFNEYIDENNIEKLLNYILKERYLTMVFYTKDETEKEVITNKLNYLFDYPSIDEIVVYNYYGDLDIKHDIKEFPKEDMEKRKFDDDYYDDYKFGNYYVDNNFKNYNYSLIKGKDSNYRKDLSQINGWLYNEYNGSGENEKTK